MRKYKNKFYIFFIFLLVIVFCCNYYLKRKIEIKNFEYQQVELINNVIRIFPGNYFIGLFKVQNGSYETIDIVGPRGTITRINPQLFKKQKINLETLEKLNSLKARISYLDIDNLDAMHTREIRYLIDKSYNKILKLNLMVMKFDDVFYIYSISQVDELDINHILKINFFLYDNLVNFL